jgi:HAD superfamily hydrolase (TIGR01509 family)
MTTAPPSTDRRRVRAVVFDLDGTLIDTEWVFTEAARRLLAGRGLAFDAVFMAEIMGTPARDSLPRFRERFRIVESVEAVADEYKRFFFEVLQSDVAPLMPGALDLVGRLETHCLPKAIATSSGREYVGRVFGPHGLLERFAFVLTAEDVKAGKPAPEIYVTAASRLGLAPEDVLVIEDSIHGVRAARAAGARVVMVPHAHTPVVDRAEADAVVASLAAPELWSMIDGEPAA